jgi:hypothetical protein
MQRPQKITFGEMRESGVRGVLIYCSHYHCSHYVTASALQAKPMECGGVKLLFPMTGTSRSLLVMRPLDDLGQNGPGGGAPRSSSSLEVFSPDFTFFLFWEVESVHL